MNKNGLWFFIACELGMAPALAAQETATKMLTLTMKVVEVTCQVNGGQGLSQQVVIPQVTVDALKAGNGVSAEAHLQVDCNGSRDQPEGITLSFEPAGGSSLLGDGSRGMLKTDREGVALALTWKYDGTPVSLLPEGRHFMPTMSAGGIWDLSVVARPVAVSGEALSGGRYTAGVRLTMRYT
ncbi:fimbrial protein [Salmonella enterica subsp. houtenae serovar 44:z36,[z38]:-]|uniref:Type 1 fimbrial protein n=1 Tax=Salmonella enterica subsp. houtenae serovar 44:z36[z38]:- TaxID=1967609 RepID=A0A736I2F5_SALHO|nr:type 1 fimbrial protein [Salmonella enterica]ECZ5471584.1 type 1 fimbrial protein [Salmonella enterica subsp. houtenae]EDP9795111.1 type 1 fimbrial protein [Salmonella enterica subsp. salamae]EHM8759206.1 fimbrial protein [Salmonella enterica subsp. houtenae serovar 44:z36,[z38]:-]HAE7581361.1 type 1 fimbrial protein [Salmonella enterica subsp. houtenae serovar 44:z36[z38]:-]HCM1978833.1 fimbrial protein [Salmonella enterica subsp. houtenae serovar 47:z36:-]HCM6269224.1 fimbrial protein [S